MASKDLYNTIAVEEAFSFSPLSGVPLMAVSTGVDLKGFESALVVVVPENSQGGPFSGTALISFEHNDVDATGGAPWEAVPSESISGNSQDEEINVVKKPRKLCYVGHKQFLRAKVTAAPGSVMRICGSFILNSPHVATVGPSE